MSSVYTVPAGRGSRRARRLVASLILGAAATVGLSLAAAAPAAAEGEVVYNPVGGGADVNDATGPYTPSTGSGSSAGWSMWYQIRSAWVKDSDRFLKDKEWRELPTPMGYYLNRENYTTWYPRRAKALYAATGPSKEKWMRHDPGKCQVTGGTTVDKSGDSLPDGIRSMPVAVDWQQRIRWTVSGDVWTPVDMETQEYKCVELNQWAAQERSCPIGLDQGKQHGPFGTLPLQNGGLGSREVSYSDATKTHVKVDPMPLDSSFKEFGKLYSSNWFKKGKKLSVDERVEAIKQCGGLKAKYDFKRPSDSTPTAGLVGNYWVTGEAEQVKCEWTLSNKITLAYTREGAWGKGSVTDNTANKVFERMNSNWRCGSPTNVPANTVLRNVLCKKDARFRYEAYYGTNAAGSINLWAWGFDFAQQYANDCYDGGSPPDTGTREYSPVCAYGPNDKPTVISQNDTNGNETRSDSGTTVMADGKRIRIVWPEPNISWPADTPVQYRVVSNRWATAIVESDAYLRKTGSRPDGSAPSDPFDVMNSFFALDGVSKLTGNSGRWNEPLELRFYKAARVDSASKTIPFKVSLYRSFDSRRTQETLTQLPDGEWEVTGSIPIAETHNCLPVSVKLYVASARSVG